MAVWYFTSTEASSSDSAVDAGVLTTLWGDLQVYRVQTFKRAYDLASTDDIITPDPDETSFTDSNGFRLSTVSVNINFRLSKNIIYAGGAYRLRMIFPSTKINYSVGTFIDVDYIGHNVIGTMLAGFWVYYPAIISITSSNYMQRCRIYNCHVKKATLLDIDLLDCCVFGCDTTSTEETIYRTGTSAYRSSFYTTAGEEPGGQNIDFGSTVDASELCLIGPAGAYDSSLADDWDDYDLRLKSTATAYQSGNGITSADGDVYDVNGIKRKVDGAVGAYEYLSDVTHVWDGANNRWCSDLTKTTATTAPTASSVLYVDENAIFDNTVRASKCYVAGWTHIQVNDNDMELVLGLQSSVRGSGNIKINGLNGNYSSYLQLSSDSNLTLTNCNLTF